MGDVFQGADDKTLIEHWDGTSWQVVASPNDLGDNRLRGVAVDSTIDVWTVGSTIPCPPPQALARLQQGTILARLRSATDTSACATSSAPPAHPLIEHWDGSAWSIIPSPIPDPKATHADLDRVVAFGKDDIWASGSSYFDEGVTPADGAALIEHWDGTAWSIMTAFDEALGGRTWSTAFLSSSDIWGAEYTTGPSGSPTIKHWNGSDWSVVAGPHVGIGSYFLETMAASAPDDLWAAGFSSPSQPQSGQTQVFTMHWNGNDWSVMPSPSPRVVFPGGTITLTASTSLSPDDAWMVGAYQASSSAQLALIEHWDGHSWSLVPHPNPAEPVPVGQEEPAGMPQWDTSVEAQR